LAHLIISLLLLLVVRVLVQVTQNLEQFHEDADDVDVQVQSGKDVFLFADLQFAVSDNHLQVVDDVHAEHSSSTAGQDEVEELSAVEDADDATDGQGHDCGHHHATLPRNEKKR
jgi:hypothetical protein